MAHARYFLSLVLLAACCALLIATGRADAHSLTPASASAISRASIDRTDRRAHSRFSFRSFMAASFVSARLSTLLNSFEVGCAPARFPL